MALRRGKPETPVADGTGTSGLRQEQAQSAATTVDLLRQARRETTRAIEVGEATTTQLALQGESLERTEKAVDNIEFNLRISDRILKGMSGWGGALSTWFSSEPKRPQGSTPTTTPTTTVESRVAASAPPPASPASSTGANGAARAPAASAKLLATKPGRDQEQKQEEPKTIGGYTVEEDQLLDGISADVAALRSQALLHREVLNDQNRRLDGLNGKVDNVGAHMKSTNAKVKRIT